MQNRWLGKSLLTLALLTVIAGALWHFRNPQTRKPAEAQPPMTRSEFKYHYTPPMVSDSVNEAQAEPERDLAGQPKIPREKVEAWLAKHNRNAASLLAAFRALEDTNYLNEAATNFPDDPQVQWTILARNAFPEDRRKWLELFKTSSPSNSLANYLSAQDYLKSGQTSEAIHELLAASGKSQFGTYSMEVFLDGEELNQFAGVTPSESGQLAFSHSMTDVLTEDGTLKQLAWSVADMEKQQVAVGDNVSAENLARMGLAFADQIRNGENGKLIINQLIGNSSAALALSGLDQNAAYDFLGGRTPSQILEQISQQKASLRELTQNFGAVYPNLTGEQMASYIDRIKIYGEVEAMRWVVQQYPPNNP